MLSTEELELIDGTKEVLIETRSGSRVFRTVIWVVVHDREVFVRSVDGEAGRWYQRALADPDVALRVGNARFRFTALPASDPRSVERASEGLRSKYRGRSLEMMLLPEVLETTLLLEPLA
jgi:hypothetical protein